MLTPLLLVALACTAPGPGGVGGAPEGDDPGAVDPRWWGEVPPRSSLEADTGSEADAGPPLVTEETVEAWESPLFSDTEVVQIEITLSDEAVAALREAPSTYVEGSVSSGGHTWGSVGVRLKGSASWQPIDQKCNWKLKFEDYSEERFYGQKRLTLNNNVWDSSAMAQDLAYRFFADAGVPSPRTGYAWVTLNGEDKGLYTILESMDGQFADREFPDSEGNLYETTYAVACDFDGDGSCFERQATGDNEPDPDHALASALVATREGTSDAIREAFDWDRLIHFLAVERVINHPDSYSYNLNNFFVYHDPIEDRVSLIPWGADSTFVYTYPPNSEDYPCSAASYRDVLTGGSVGALASFCEGDGECSAYLTDAMSEVADLLDTVDLAGRAEANRERLRPYVEADPYIIYSPENFENKVDCFVEWIHARPAELHAWLGD